VGRPRKRLPLTVFLNGRLVGHLKKETSGAIDFQYDPAWLHWEHTFPISLSLPLREDRYIGDGVVAVLDNLLPDNAEIRRRVAARVSAEGADAYALLAAIGRDCVGALQFLPDGATPGPAGRIKGLPIDEERIGALLANLGPTPLGVSPEDEEFRISIAGVQDKTALLFWKNKWYLPHASTGTTHILKPQIGVRGNGLDLSKSVENEHLCMRLTSALGLPTAATEIQEFAGKRVLVIQRFDRQWTRDKRLLRIPQEDCCQALSVPPVRKSQTDGGPGIRQILQFLKASDHPAEDQRLFIKAQIAFWLLGATDGHAKNFSVFLHPGGGFRLTPLYDVMSAQPLLDAKHIQRKQMRLAMAVGDTRHYILDTILPRHFIQSAAQAGMSAGVVNAVMTELLEQAPQAIATAQEQLPDDFPESISGSIMGGFQRRLSLMEENLKHLAG